MILTLSVVLLATFDYIHAKHCSTALASYMKSKCLGLKLKFVKLSECLNFTIVKGKNSIRSTTNYSNLIWRMGMPCGITVKQCCYGICTPVEFSSQDPPTPIACTE
uniref:Putative secreted protein n=1 Tax=Ixodes ricinus TaxID=34613 RepID=V5IIM1_IXORI